MLGKINLNLSTKNKAIQQYKAKHQSVQKLLEKANERYERSRIQICDQCQQMNETLGRLKRKSKQFITACKQALHDSKTQQIINMKELSQYLKKQKEQLKKVAQQKQIKPQDKIDLHKIGCKVELQKVLTKIKRMQLQEQIKFLQANVIVKGNFIYNPSNSVMISPTEDKENTEKLSNRILELERLIQLSIPCANNSNITHKLSRLKYQSSRIQECQDLVAEQYQKLVKFNQFIQQRRESASKFTLQNPSLNMSFEESLREADEYEQLKVDQRELDSWLDLNEQKPLVINMQHPFMSLDEEIGEVRAKIKKIQKLM